MKEEDSGGGDSFSIEEASRNLGDVLLCTAELGFDFNFGGAIFLQVWP